MKNNFSRPPVWVYIVLWSCYIALIGLFGEYVISRPVEGWIQFASSTLVIIGTYYFIRFNIKSILYNKKNTEK